MNLKQYNNIFNPKYQDIKIQYVEFKNPEYQEIKNPEYPELNICLDFFSLVRAENTDLKKRFITYFTRHSKPLLDEK